MFKAKKTNPKIEQIVSYIKKESRSRNCTVKLTTSYDKTLQDISDGEFSEMEMRITCYRNNKDPKNYWLGVLVHEYCHLIQSSENQHVWSNFQKIAEVYEKELDELFLNKKNSKLNKNNRIKLSQAIIKLELDCERKAIKLLKKLNAPIDYNYYIACANIVLYKYLYWAETGKWIILNKDKADFPEILDLLKKDGFNKLKTVKDYCSIKLIPKNLLDVFRANSFY